MIRPSSLPMLSRCPCFESRGSDFAEVGQDRHAALKAHLQSEDSLLELLEEEDAEAVRWGADYIRLHAPTSDYPLQLEVRVDPLDYNFQPLFANGGTADVICGPDLFDFKWRQRDYSVQMAAYALDILQSNDFPFVRVHELYGAIRYAKPTYKLAEEDAWEIVEPIITNARFAETHSVQPVPNEYCGWCEKRLTCPALTTAAQMVSKGYAEESDLIATVESWHPSEMESPDQLALALTIARRILSPWIKSVEFHAKDAAVKQGLKLPGYELKEKRGKTFVADVAQAHELLGLEPAMFLSCCDLRLNTSKKYSNRKGIIDVFAAENGIKKAPAKREVMKKLSDVIQTTQPSLSLVAVGETEEEEE